MDMHTGTSLTNKPRGSLGVAFFISEVPLYSLHSGYVGHSGKTVPCTCRHSMLLLVDLPKSSHSGYAYRRLRPQKHGLHLFCKERGLELCLPAR
jgi:hypothetical protein